MDNINEGGTSVDATTLLKIKSLVNDLEKIEGGSEFTDNINPVFGGEEAIVRNFLTQNMTSVKEALNELVDKNGPLGASSQEQAVYLVGNWQRKYSSLGNDILNKLADMVVVSTKEGSSPKDVVKILLTGSDEQIAEKLIATILNKY